MDKQIRDGSATIRKAKVTLAKTELKVAFRNLIADWSEDNKLFFDDALNTYQSVCVDEVANTESVESLAS
jgi:hypothetical protein